MKKKLFRFITILASLGSFLLVLGITFLFIIKVDSSKENSQKVSGEVRAVFEGGVKDVVFKLKDDNHTYYINRGFENGLNLAEMEKAVLNDEVELWYARGSKLNFLNPGGKVRHITKLAIADRVLYSEW